MEDWSRDEIKAAIKSTGVSGIALGKKHGFGANAVAATLTRPWPAIEAIIAKHIGSSPAAIWPSRYDAEGRPKAGGWSYPNRRTVALHGQNGTGA